MAAVLTLTSLASAASWEIDPAHSSATFSVRHMMISNVRGEFAKVTGNVVHDPKSPGAASVDATIDVSTLNTRELKRDADLKSENFFDVAKYPTMSFKSKKVAPAGTGKLKLTGDLTIHGVTKEVTFDVDGPTAEVKDPWGNIRIGASATTKINRKDFGMTWNKALDTGGVMVGDEVTITLDVEMVKKAAPAGEGGKEAGKKGTR
jgi:polyisoprenoid-binding protein YceI